MLSTQLQNPARIEDKSRHATRKEKSINFDEIVTDHIVCIVIILTNSDAGCNEKF